MILTAREGHFSLRARGRLTVRNLLRCVFAMRSINPVRFADGITSRYTGSRMNSRAGNVSSLAAQTSETGSPALFPMWVAALLLVVITFIAYFPAMQAGFIWDDDDYVTRNETLRSVDGLGRIWIELGAVPQYYPLVHTTFWVEYHLWGLNPLGFHLVNIALHALGAVLLYALLTRLKIPGSGAAAWFAAAVFALHPVHVESVAWITERKNVLSAAVYLAAMLAYLRFDPFTQDSNASMQPRRWGWYALALALFIGALLSKTVTCSFPAAILLLIWWKRGRINWRDIAPTIPMFIVGIAAGLLTAWMEKHHVGAQGEDWQLSVLQRCLLAGRVAWFYAFTLVWPMDLAFIYPRWTIDPSQWWQWMHSMSAIAVVLALFLMRNRIGRGPLVAVLCFGGTLFPALGFFDVYPFRFSFVADHFQHLASIGLTVLIVAMIASLAQRLGRNAMVGFSIAGVTVLAILGTLTWRQCQVYENLETLWRDTLIKNPDSYMPHYNLGKVLFDKGEFEEAVTEYEAALATRPRLIEARNSIGQALIQLGRRNEALPQFEKALEIDSEYPQAHNNIGWLLAAEGRFDEAIERYRRALSVDPDFTEARNNLGAALAANGDSAGAIAQFNTAMKANPNDAVSHVNLAMVLQKQGDRAAAIAQLRKAVELQPAFAEAHYKLGAALAQDGQWEEAIRSLERAVELAPRNASAITELAAALAMVGQAREALPHFRAIVQMSLRNAPAWNNLAQCLIDVPDATTEERTEAIRAAQRACELSGQRDPIQIQTLAVAQAKAAQFEQAAVTAQRAAVQARIAGDEGLAAALEAEAQGYRDRTKPDAASNK